MTEEQRLWLIEAMKHLEMIDGYMDQHEASDRATAALYLVQRAVTGHVPPNWASVMDTVRGVDALNELADIQERSKKGRE